MGMDWNVWVVNLYCCIAVGAVFQDADDTKDLAVALRGEIDMGETACKRKRAAPSCRLFWCPLGLAISNQARLLRNMVIA